MLDHAVTIKGMEVAAAINRANILRGEFAALFAGIDLLLVPVLMRPTPEAGTVEQAVGSNPAVAMDMARFTTPFNITGQPTITLRGGSDERGLPIGFQLVARHFEEELLFRAGHAFQCATDWHTRHPSLVWCADYKV
jgi:amidase